MKPDTNNPRVSEWILAAYFTYTSVLALVLPIDPAMSGRALLANALVAVSYVLLLRTVRRGGSEWPGVLRDWAPLALALLAYKQMGWFAPAGHDYALERSWIVWDRMVLHQWGLRSAIESLGVVVPSVLELSYLLVYAFPVFCMGLLYAYKRREQADALLTVYLLGLCLAYVQFPFWPSEPPRTVFAGQDLPLVATFVRRINLALLGSQGIHTSVFPSAHVSGAFAAAFAMRGVFPDKPWLRWGTLVYAILVALATVYGRYHYAADALAGFGVSVVAAGLGARLLRSHLPAEPLLEQPLPQLGLAVGLVPRIVAHAGVLGVLRGRAGGLERLDHLLRLGNRHRGVRASVENPDGSFADLARRRGIRIARGFLDRRQIGTARHAHPAANGNQRGELTGLPCAQAEGAVPAHR